MCVHFDEGYLIFQIQADISRVKIIFEQKKKKKKKIQTSSSSDTFSPKFRMLSSFSASRSLTFISSSCRQLIISSFCRMMSALNEEGWQSSWSKPGCLVVSTISESFRIRSLAVSSSPLFEVETVQDFLC